ncbi:MAG TPA: carbamoyltransferase C-terminal domain-containing protein [Solirubrobacterales bacterium]|nr:carbamoyltransferase C-terminal domain-containing protein [Solirubrobacterales bacterium]
MSAAVLGVNAVFHDSAAALVVDGEIVAAVEEERFSRRKHGKLSVAFSTWELPEQAARWCLERAGLAPADLDAVAYSYDPSLAGGERATGDPWEDLRTTFASRAPRFLKTSLPGLDPERVRFVPHHVSHAASAYHAAGFESCAVLILDGRGEVASHLAGHRRDGRLEVLAAQRLPDSLGLVYEELTEHLGFRRSSDEYKVMAMASYGRPSMLGHLRGHMRVDGEGGFVARGIDWNELAPRLESGDEWTPRHADLAASVQTRLEEVLLELCGWLADRTGERRLAMAGGVALNCVANSRLLREGPFDEIWVQPAAGDSGTALGAATHVSEGLGAAPQPMQTAALGREWSDEEIESWLLGAAVPFERCQDIGAAAAERLARNQIVAWHQGRGEWGPRALGHRSLLADPRDPANLERLNEIKGREQFRPVAPMVLESRAAEIFEGPIPSPHMLFTHRVRPGWSDRIAAAVHVDGTARIQTVAPRAEPLVARLLAEFERRTGVPVVINTSLNTAGRPMVDDPRDALECFGSAPIDFLAIGPFLVSRGRFFDDRREALSGAAVASGVG